MKKLSDYKDDEAFELWANMLEPISIIFKDKEFINSLRNRKAPLLIAKELIKAHSKEVKEVLLMIDDTPIDALNIITRLVNLLSEIGQNKDVSSFFGFAAQAKPVNVSSGSAMENIEDDVK